MVHRIFMFSGNRTEEFGRGIVCPCLMIPCPTWLLLLFSNEKRHESNKGNGLGFWSNCFAVCLLNAKRFEKKEEICPVQKKTKNKFHCSHECLERGSERASALSNRHLNGPDRGEFTKFNVFYCPKPEPTAPWPVVVSEQ